MPDSQWAVVKEDWPVRGKSSDRKFTKRQIDKIFSQIPKKDGTK